MHKLAYLILVVCVAVLAACGSTATPAPAAVGTDIQVLVPADDFTPGQSRVPFLLYDGPNRVADAQAVTVTLYDLSQTTPAPVWQGTAENYSDYVVPYWVVYPEIPVPGNWGLRATITTADGGTALSDFAIAVPDKNGAPVLGAVPPASQNRTLATVPDIAQLTSATEPNPALYQQTVAEAIASGRPSVITFNTPAFCQTAICAPVLDSVEAVQAEFGDRVNFIHLEIYKAFNPELVTADEVIEWGLTSEPWTFVLDKDGRVVARLAGPVSPRELTAALTPLLQN